MNAGDDVPVGFVIVMAAAGMAGVAIAARALANIRAWSRLSRTRVYAARHDVVRAAAVDVIGRLGHSVSHRDEQAVSFTVGYLGESPMAPVVHVVILPTEDGRTTVEVIGSRGPYHYWWHTMAQGFLTALDETTATLPPDI